MNGHAIYDARNHASETANRYLWVITNHTHSMYRKRVGDGMLMERLDEAYRPGKKLKKKILRRAREVGTARIGYCYPWFYLVSDSRAYINQPPQRVVFVCRVKGKRLKVITCFLLPEPPEAT